MPSLAAEPSRIRSTTFSPNSVGQVLTRKSIDLVLDRLSLMRPSCGTRRSAMSSRAMTFRREEMRGVQLDRRRGHRAQHAVHAEAHAEVGLVRLEMDVRGAALDRVDQHLVDELDDRRVVVAVGVDAARFAVVVDRAELEVLQAFGIVEAARSSVAAGVERLFDRAVAVCRSSTRIGSTMWLDWNLISSSARRLVGSETPTNRRLPRLNSGSAVCFVIRSSLTSFIGKLREIQRLDVEQRHAELGRRGHRDLALATSPLLDQPRARSESSGVKRRRLPCARRLRPARRP